MSLRLLFCDNLVAIKTQKLVLTQAKRNAEFVHLQMHFSAAEYFLHLPFSSVHLIKVFAQDSFVVIYSALRVA